VVHPVEAPDEGALAAAGGADHRRDQVLVDVEVDVLDGKVRAVARRQALDLEDRLTLVGRRLAAFGNVDRPHRRHGNRLVHLLLLSQRPSFRLLRASSARATMLVTRTKVISTSAEAQARL